MKLKRYFTVLLVLSLYGCDSRYNIDDYLKVEDVRSNLTYGLTSYITFDEVKAKLQLQEGDFIIVENNNASEQPGIPPFDIFTIKIASAQIADHNGGLVLSFFNSRLMEMRYYPNEIDDFVEKISLDPKALRELGGFMIEPYTKAWISKDYQGKYYVGWIDIRLRDQFNTWIKNFS